MRAARAFLASGVIFRRWGHPETSGLSFLKRLHRLTAGRRAHCVRNSRSFHDSVWFFIRHPAGQIHTHTSAQADHAASTTRIRAGTLSPSSASISSLVAAPMSAMHEEMHREAERERQQKRQAGQQMHAMLEGERQTDACDYDAHRHAER